MLDAFNITSDWREQIHKVNKGKKGISIKMYMTTVHKQKKMLVLATLSLQVPSQVNIMET